LKTAFFKSASDLRAWLAKNHAKTNELGIGFYKKLSGKPSVTYSEAVDEALCFGWIDGLRKSLDATAYMVRFTPRKPKSKWSAVNIKRMHRLIEAHRLHASGLKAFEGARDQKRAYSYEQRNDAKLDRTGERQFRANEKAWLFFSSTSCMVSPDHYFLGNQRQERKNTTLAAHPPHRPFRPRPDDPTADPEGQPKTVSRKVPR
jgi:uncharacterized protein YdeI (YjbR/CyaY-like superfamily)